MRLFDSRLRGNAVVVLQIDWTESVFSISKPSTIQEIRESRGGSRCDGKSDLINEFLLVDLFR